MPPLTTTKPKHTLSRLLDRAAKGEPFIVAGRQTAGQGRAAGNAGGGSIRRSAS